MVYLSKIIKNTSEAQQPTPLHRGKRAYTTAAQKRENCMAKMEWEPVPCQGKA